MRISKNFSLAEFVKSETAIENRIGNMPNEIEIKALIYLVMHILQPARDFLGFVIRVTSGFRSLRLNTLIGGSKTSQHCKGQAADLQCDDNAALFHFIKDNLTFDQLIWEFGDDNQPAWVHVSIVENGENRGQVLRAIKENDKTRYYAFI